jgi:hypothetical protein
MRTGEAGNRLPSVWYSDGGEARDRTTAKEETTMAKSKTANRTIVVPDSDEAFEQLLETEPTVLLLRTCREDMTSHGGYRWPEIGKIARPEVWSSSEECGDGLHAWLWAKGEGGLGYWYEPHICLVVRALARTVVDLYGKVKVPACRVEFVGTLEEAAQYIEERLPAGIDPVDIIGRVATAGDDGIAIAAGFNGKATAGDRGRAIAGDCGTATAGYQGTAIAGSHGKATAGDGGTATVTFYGTATVGNGGTAFAGNGGSATAGDFGKATAGESGVATVGKYGTATAGHYGLVQAWEGGRLVLDYWDGSKNVLKIAYVGKDGIEPGVFYTLDSLGYFKKVQNANRK